MRGVRERIHLPGGQSFRAIRWSRNLLDIECLLDSDQAYRIAGEGAHWHYHQEMELTLFTSGGGTRFVGDHIGPFSAGDVVLLGEKLPHYWHVADASSGISVQWHFPENHPFWGFPETFALKPLFGAAGRGVRYTGSTGAALTTELQRLPRASVVDRLAILLRLFAIMMAAPESDRSFLSTRSFCLPTSSQYQETMGAVMRYLMANFRGEVRLEDVLRLSGLSRPTFARQFKRHSGRTLREFLNQLRLEAARRALAESEREVLEIALACGFTQLSFFNRIFHRVVGCAPTEFRAREHRRSQGKPSPARALIRSQPQVSPIRLQATLR